MKKTIFIFFTIFLIFSCKEVKKKIEQFMFDMTKVSVVYHYEYKYNNAGKKITQIEKSKILLPDKRVIRDTTTTTFIYGKNGKIEKEISVCTTEDNSKIKIYKYDSNDSLILRLTINPNGDTTVWQTSNEPLIDGKKEHFERYLFLSNSYFENNTSSRIRIYDTSYFKTEKIYINNLEIKDNGYNQRNQLVETQENEYLNGKTYREFDSIYINSFKILKWAKYYNYLKSETKPDFYTLDKRQDTIMKETNEFYDGKLALTIDVFNINNSKTIDKLFYENDKLIGIIDYKKEQGIKKYSSYTYYPNGDIKEENEYTEKIQ